MSKMEKLLAEIERQQENEKDPAVKMAGNQLAELCQGEERLAGIVLEDFAAGKSIRDAEAAIRKKADERHRTQNGTCVCIDPQTAVQAICEAFGLPDPGDGLPQPRRPERPDEAPAAEAGGDIDFLALL